MSRPQTLTRCDAWTLYRYEPDYGYKFIGYSVNGSIIESFVSHKTKAIKTHLYMDDKGQYYSVQSIAKRNII